ncbi:ABC transporter permease [Nakamurella alba]|uniref:ABC transporter permease n=1 Tax=Nakamurella alba TaxID=2665158 RepID=UPI002AC31E34|nr:ABC transporter permease subunit [Nakamurella alba]
MTDLRERAGTDRAAAARSGATPGPNPEPLALGRLRTAGLLALAAVPVLVLLVLFFYPVAVIVGQGFAGPDGVGALGDVLARSRIRRIVLFTVWQAAASAGLCLLLGLPLAHLLYRRRFRGRAVARAVITVPFVLPTVVVGLAFRTLLAENGPLGSWGLDGSVWAVLAAHVCLNVAVVVRTVGLAWAGIDDRTADAARSLGAGPLRVLRTVTLPALGPAIAAAAVMVFLFCATSFGIMQVLGGGRYSTIETEIWRQTEEMLDLPTASVLSVLQLVLVCAVLVVAARLRRRTERTLRRRSVRTPQVGRRDLPAVIVGVLVGLVVLGPVVVMMLRSLRTPGGGWGLQNYRALAGVGEDNVLLVPVTDALVNSLQSAAVAAAVAIALGAMLAVVLGRRPRSRAGRRATGLLDAVVMLPLGVSAVTVGFGFLVALDAPPLDLRSSWLLVPLAQALVVTPLVVRMLVPLVRSTDDRLRQAAGVLGAPPLTVWRTVDLPLAARGAAGAAAFAFAVALGEFGATSFLARPRTPTLPVVIGRLISRPGEVNAGMALAAATVLALLCVLVVAAIDLLGDTRRAGGIGGF